MTSLRSPTTTRLCAASNDERERLIILLLKSLNQVIGLEQQAGLSRRDRERLSVAHQQIRSDLATMRYWATKKTVTEIKCGYRADR